MTTTPTSSATLAQTAVFLRDLPATWNVVTPAERNALARAEFQTVTITDSRLTGVLPTAAAAPFVIPDVRCPNQRAATGRYIMPRSSRLDGAPVLAWLLTGRPSCHLGGLLVDRTPDQRRWSCSNRRSG